MPFRRNIILGAGSPELVSVPLAPSAGSVPAPTSPPPWLPCPPASVPRVLSDAVDLERLTVANIIYMSYGGRQADVANKPQVPPPLLAQEEEEAVGGRCPEASLLERTVEAPSHLTFAFEFLQHAFEPAFF